MTDVTTDVTAAGAEGEETLDLESLASEATEEGRYIPYSGGSMGWFENSGVLECERGNNYLYYTAMASDRVRSKQFQRWGDRFNRRGDRRRANYMTGVTLQVGKGGVRGTTRDISMHGVRLQFLDAVTVERGDTVRVQLHQSETSDAVTVELDAQVVWHERVGKIRPVWNVGLSFTGLTEQQNDALRPLVAV